MTVLENYPVFVAIIIGSMVVSTVAVFILQFYCKKYFGINFCPGSGPVLSRSGRVARISAMEERRHAMVSRRQLDTQQLGTKRKERMSRYKALLKNNKMAVTEEDLVHDVECCDVEVGSSAETRNHVDRVLLRLPRDKDGKTVCVAGNCAVCIAEYTPGDKVVWSTNSSCIHAFHEECILLWLSKGKKRCPICRNNFAPVTLSSHCSKETPVDGGEESEESSSVAANVPETTHGDIESQL